MNDIKTIGWYPNANGWYHSHDKRSKHFHLFNNGKTVCGHYSRADIFSDMPLPEGSCYSQCPECMGYPRAKETLIKQSCAQRGIPISEFDGFSKYKPYCEKFNKKFKDRVRAFFGYTCVLCGEPQNGRRLQVHHINYEKGACCDKNIIPLFVSLCNSCHIKTNSNRKYWENYFTKLINEYYGGKCYFTQSEMNQIKGYQTS